MKQTLSILLLGALSVATSHAETTVPHTFSANTPAKASEVNENFSALKNAIDSAEKQYHSADYFDSKSSIKKFDLEAAYGAIEFSYSYTKSGNMILSEMIKDSTLREIRTYTIDESGIRLVKVDIYDESNNNDLKSSITFDENYLLFPQTIKVGQSWGLDMVGASVIDYLNSGSIDRKEKSVNSYYRLMSVEMKNILGTEYECLNIAKTTRYASMNIKATRMFKNTYCKGIGFVGQVSLASESQLKLKEMK